MKQDSVCERERERDLFCFSFVHLSEVRVDVQLVNLPSRDDIK